jgi:hypothetical protein
MFQLLLSYHLDDIWEYICKYTITFDSKIHVSPSLQITEAIGPKKDEITGEWRKLHNEELSDL